MRIKKQLKIYLAQELKKHLKYVLLGTGIIIGLFWYIHTNIFQFFATVPTIGIEMQVPENNVSIEDTFTVGLRLTDQEVAATDVFIEYDSNFVSYALEEGAETGISQLPIDYFSMPPVKEEVIETDTSLKRLHIVLVSWNQIEDPDNPFTQLNFVFHAKSEGVATFTLLKNELQFVGNDSQKNPIIFEINEETVLTKSVQIGDIDQVTPTEEITPVPTESPAVTVTETLTSTPTLTETPSPIITQIANPEEVQLDIRLRLQGIVGKPVAVGSGISMKLSLISEDKSNSYEQDVLFQPSDSGVLTGTMILKSAYTGPLYKLLIKGPKHLQKRICEAHPKEAVGGTYNCTKANIQLKKGNNNIQLENIIILAGDIPEQDSVINAQDIVFIRQSLGSKNVSDISRGDLNFDGIIDSQDYSMILNALSFKYDD
ncbi:hypothetical protein COY16_04575 [Candidatus Roizmanbacteria bacterium CG_4_10_14_0_2_um_filter_39_13]|uniref:Dockerin domain-containing protein n=1 Tax=Candidatus Roizmanbacteria bacterium CG_4_10_14_0_2_um_filter_39_13 TaxID=1974825 RepID=A0A2M7TXM3_9BACT|nr:MAG: hypothetical protein COY16_04575 [Candidatus Roizmanbacteria bacterium CG_4_10_14_0_2_um_filter_39_13]